MKCGLKSYLVHINLHKALCRSPFYTFFHVRIADNIIKIWRVYPYAQEALTPLMSFFCAHLPVHMVVLKTKLCVAFEDHGTATYSVIVHNLENKGIRSPVGAKGVH